MTRHLAIRSLLFAGLAILASLAPSCAHANDAKATLANGEIKSGKISGAGSDLYSLEVKEGGTFMVELTDTSEKRDPDFVPSVDLMQPDGTPATGSGRPFHVKVEMPVTTPGAWKAKITQLNPASGGSYSIQFVQVPGIKSRTLKFNETYKGVSASGNVTVLGFNGTPGAAARVAMRATGGGEGYRPTLSVYNPAGALMSGYDAGKEWGYADINMDSYDSYFIVVDLGEGSSEHKGSFEVTVRRPDDNFPPPPEPSQEVLQESVLNTSAPPPKTTIVHRVPFYIDGLLVSLSSDPSGASDWKAAQEGNVEAMVNLGDSNFKIVPTDVKWWLKAAENHADNARNRLLVACARDYIKEKICGITQALPWYRTASDQGNIDAPVALSSLYKGKGAPADDAGIVALSRGYAEQGKAGAQYLLGVAYAQGSGVAKDYTEAEKWFRKAAEQGFGPAEYSLGNLYRYKHGTHQVDMDAFEAFRWYKKAFEHGVPAATIRVANMYLFGHGESQDYAKAAGLYRKAAEQGMAVAQFNLAGLYSLGLGVNPDFAETAKWLRKAADQGMIAAQQHLGELYENGMGVGQDYAQAAAFLRKAADAGIPTAQFFLGQLYKNGQGVAKDDAQAQIWLKKALDSGMAEAKAELAELQGPQGAAEAMKIWEDRAAKGDTGSMQKLIAAFRAGSFAPQDPEKTLAIFRGGANTGNPEAIAAIGDFFADGKYWPQSDYEAYFWYRLAVLSAPKWNAPPEEKDKLLKYAAERADQKAKTLSKEQLAFTDWRIDDRAPKPPDKSKKEAAAFYLIGDQAEDKGDYAAARDIYIKAADQGINRAQHDLGRLYEYAMGVARNIPAAIRWYKKAITNGLSGSANKIGEMYQFGIGVPVDLAEAEKWYEMDASRGHARARNMLGSLYLGRKESKKAISLYERAVAMGSAEAADVLGMIYLYGIGVPEDPQRALKWYKLSAQAGTATGRIQAAAILVNYEPHDYNLAFGYVSHIVTPVALNNMAYMIENGLVKDPKQTPEQQKISALDIYKKAADMCYGRAMYNLARLYETGIQISPAAGTSVPPDPDQANELMRAGAAYGSEAAAQWVSVRAGKSAGPSPTPDKGEVTMPPKPCPKGDRQ